jgi:signal transduction histidine kinase
MSYVTLIWSVAAAAASLLALLHGLAWMHDRRAHARLAFAVACACLSALAVLDLAMLRASSPQEWGALLRWMQLPMFGLLVGIALFLRLYLRAGRSWLLVGIIASRTAMLAINFFSDTGINFAHIDSIAQLWFLGEPVTVVTGAAHGDYQWLGPVSSVLYLAFIADAGVTLWRRNTPDDRRMLALVVAPLGVALALSVALAQLVIWRIVAIPFLFVPPFLVVLIAMTVEVSRELLCAARLTRELRESQQRVELAADAAGAGLWSWDVRAGRLWMTDRARMVLALGSGELHPRDLLCALDARQVLQSQDPFHQALQRGGSYSMEFRVDRSNGAVRWILSCGNVQLGIDRRPALIRGAVRDVTRECRAEIEVNDLRRKLAHAGRVSLLGQLASGLAHELSQPLSAIQNNVETAQILLERDPLDVGELRKIVDDVLRDNRRGTEVLRRLRAWFTEGRMSMEAVRMEEIVQDMIALVRSDAVSKNVAIVSTVLRAVPPVHGDRVHLSQVLLNLLVNAIEAAADRNDGRREVRIEARVGADGWCEVAVSDTGLGIPSGQLDRIFEPFVTAKAKGMGIGLSISRTIIEAHQGRLWAESSERGAKFRFTVPLHAANANELACPA